MSRAAWLLLSLLCTCSPHRDYSQADGGAGVDTGPPDAGPCAGKYPAAPFGLHQDEVFPPVTLQVRHAGATEWTTLSFCDVFDPDGSRGERAIVVVAIAKWCPPCDVYARDLSDALDTKGYRARGTYALGAMTEQDPGVAATQATADAFITANAPTFDIALDDRGQTVAPDGNGYPYTYVVDPRTMQIRFAGFKEFASTILPHVETLLEANGSPKP